MNCSANIIGWTFMLCIGFNAAISVRVSNELGAGHPRRAKFSVLVVSITSLAIGALLTLLLILTRSQYPLLLTNNAKVQKMVYDLTPVLGVTLFVNTLQPTLSGSSIISIQFDGMGYKYWRHGVLRAVSVKNKIGFINGKVVSSMGRSSQSQYLVYLDWRSGNVVTIW
ncbi:hypothetical protein P3S68_022359 [Capsicum galapagoense]